MEVDTQGDAFFFAFQTAPGALTAAAARSPSRWRPARSTSASAFTREGRSSPTRATSATTCTSPHESEHPLTGGKSCSRRRHGRSLTALLTDLGEHRLKDIKGAVSIYQLGDKTFPPLKTISNTNLPRPASSSSEGSVSSRRSRRVRARHTTRDAHRAGRIRQDALAVEAAATSSRRTRLASSGSVSPPCVTPARHGDDRAGARR